MMLLTIPLHLIVIIQDLKYREISAINILFLFIISIALKIIGLNTLNWSSIFLNEILIMLQLYLMVLSIKLRRGVEEKVIDVYFGKGDVYLLMILGLSVNTSELFQMYLLSLGISVIAFFLWKIITARSITIPLAAILSAVFIAFQFKLILDQFGYVI
jgi:hypothetical protein